MPSQTQAPRRDLGSVQTDGIRDPVPPGGPRWSGRVGESLFGVRPIDERGQRRSFGVVELATPEAAAAAMRKLEGHEMRGKNLVLRNDDALVRCATLTIHMGVKYPSEEGIHRRKACM